MIANQALHSLRSSTDQCQGAGLVGVWVANGRKTGLRRVAAVIFSYRTVSFLLQLPSAHPCAASHLARRAGRAFAGHREAHFCRRYLRERTAFASARTGRWSRL